MIESNTRQVILSKNTEDSVTLNSVIVTRPTIDNCAQTLSHPTINWFDELNQDLLNHEFTVAPVIICDLSTVEAEYHAIYPTSKYDENKYYDATMPLLLEAIEDDYKTAHEAAEMIGEWLRPTIKYIDFTKFIGPMGKTKLPFNDVCESNGIEYLVYFFNHIDRTKVKYTKERGMCIHDIKNKKTTAYLSFEQFLQEMGTGTYAFAGELDRVTNCSTVPGNVTPMMNDGLNQQIIYDRIVSYDSIKQDKLHKLELL